MILADVPDSALILRRHGLGSNLFSCLIFNELQAFNPRDQLPFAFVRDHMKPNLKLNMFEVEVFEQVAVEYRQLSTSAMPTSTPYLFSVNHCPLSFFKPPPMLVNYAP